MVRSIPENTRLILLQFHEPVFICKMYCWWYELDKSLFLKGFCSLAHNFGPTHLKTIYGDNFGT